jgi:hypothetical protein
MTEDILLLRRRFPDYKIWREERPGRVRFVARGGRQGVHPHTVVTADLDELRDALSGSILGTSSDGSPRR